MVTPLDPLLQRVDHVVPQVVEPELVVGPVGDVGVVRSPSLGGARLVEIDDVHLKPQELVDHPHPLGVTLGQVGVDRDEVRTTPRQGIQIEGHGGHQGLSLPCGHLRHLTPVKGDPPDELNVVGNHVPGHLLACHHDGPANVAAAGLLHDGEGLGKDIVEGYPGGLQQLTLQGPDHPGQSFPVAGILRGALLLPMSLDALLQAPGTLLHPNPELLGLRPELFIGERGKAWEDPVDLVHNGLELLHFPGMLGAQELLEQCFHDIDR